MKKMLEEHVKNTIFFSDLLFVIFTWNNLSEHLLASINGQRNQWWDPMQRKDYCSDVLLCIGNFFYAQCFPSYESKLINAERWCYLQACDNKLTAWVPKDALFFLIDIDPEGNCYLIVDSRCWSVGIKKREEVLHTGPCCDLA